jgi:RNA polymerase sigma-70 factor (ECF subfamily)
VPRPSPTSQPVARARAAPTAELEFSRLYDEWFERVVVWLGSLGAPRSDVEDLAQEVFIVVRRRLPEFDRRNVPGWLFQIARRQVLRHKRLVWVKRVLSFGSEPAPSLGASTDPDPLESLESREQRQLVEQVLSQLSEKRRVVFALFEIEGQTGEEIAALLDVPVNTVWTRLYHARRDFHRALAAHQAKERP